MNVTDEILEKLRHLPEEKQAEVLDFVEFLESKQSGGSTKEWNTFSLAQAMEGMEEEPSLYTMNDIKSLAR